MSNNTSYDKALLDEAPEVTPQQRQRFYDADLLSDDRPRDGNGAALPAGAAAPVGATRSNTDLEAGTGTGGRSKEYSALPPSSSAKKTPWYKTRKGIIGLVILAIVIVGAVVGGAVGGTVGNDDNDDDSNNVNGESQVSTLPPNIPVTPTSASTSTEAPSGAAPIGTEEPEPSTATEAPVGTGTATPDAGQQAATAAVVVANDVPSTV